MASPPRKKDWVLTQAAFDKLLQRLDPSLERAALKYENIRLSLTEFFRSRGCHGCADLADETIDRAQEESARASKFRQTILSHIS